MGTYWGHVIPGAFFLVYGFWWTFTTNLNYFYDRGTSPRQAQSSRNAQKREHDLNKRSWLPLPWWPRIVIEPAIKVLLPLLGMLLELLIDLVPVNGNGMAPNGTVTAGPLRLGISPVDLSVTDSDLYPVERVQHGTMYAFFLVSGIIDLVSLVVRLPKKTGHIFLSLAFGIEGLLFMFHVGGRQMLDIRIHTVLVYAIFLCSLAAAARMYSATNLFINSLVCFGLILQGTWFIQAAEILYGSHASRWHWSNHHDSMLVALIGAWHVLGIALFLLIAWLLARFVHSWRSRRGGGKGGMVSAFLPQRLKESSFIHGLQGRVNMSNGDAEAEVGLLRGEERKETSVVMATTASTEETLELQDVTEMQQ